MAEKFMDFYTKAEINAMLGGLSFCKISKDDYDALTTKDENTIYYVYDETGKIVQYFGTVEMTNGSGAPVTVTLLSKGATSYISGNATFSEVE